MLRISLRIISLGTVLLLLGCLLACAEGMQTASAEGLTIADITSNPTKYEGKTVTVSGEYRGWESGHGSPPVTRSDWVIKDGTGAIYVTGKAAPGLDPTEDRGKGITVYGVVKVKGEQAYIEAEKITR